MEEIKNIRINGTHKKTILLDVFYQANSKPKPVIVFCHGFKGFKDWGTFDLVAKQFAEEGFVFIKFNFSHNGTNPENPDEILDKEAFGNNNFSIELDDLNDVLDWVEKNDFLTEEDVEPGNINLIGHSRGGAIALIKTVEDKRIKKVVTWAAVNDLSKGWNAPEFLESWKEAGTYFVLNKRTGIKLPLKYQIVEDFEKNRDRYDIKKAVTNTEKPIMVIHGTEDESVPFEHAIDMKKWNKAINMELIPHGNHTFGGFHPYTKDKLPDDLKLIIGMSAKFLKGIPERRRRKRT